MRILLVDDEAELTDPLTQVLSREGYEVDVADNGIAGTELALQKEYDLIVLDWMLPYKSGIEICRELRSRTKTTPVLFLTAKDTVDDRVIGLDVGADDYLVKPFELRELLARVRALLRRSSAFDASVTETEARIKVADLELDSENQVAYRQGRAIHLSEKEIKLLHFFMCHPGQLLTHEQIYQYLWMEKEQPNSNVLAALIRLLRRKIEADGESPLIHTVYGKGYRFGEPSQEITRSRS
ncbi:MAG: response regulator transcription factor [Hydrococcus sp. C42_A2020_068]|uniref:two-component system response regulator RppA n=1 Tax=Pleurocapsa sp. PCC 7327 TaxID=118163 RepID=UPI00029F9E5A|nr:two-component system response regulator RppA [Pleurocapsa sp. PCC 7327]AFY77885.1 response regulator with CheY-like receiver domain and winged-helix DNA-binding domain [Pleurocapsa sp. PCC 7327]MBF2019280.1 response regulator transcription factor [Hydrococcus sp. C42_A2020_068]